MNKKPDTKDYFFCYSARLSQYLIERNNPFITMAIESRTGKKFTLFKITEFLNICLKEYKTR